MDAINRNSTLTPREFELEVKALLEAAAGPLSMVTLQNRDIVDGVDGSYEIDVAVRFRAFGADFLLLAECKQHNHPIKRETVQILHGKIQSTGAHKGILFSTAQFQQGAVEYAQVHGIALVQVASGNTTWFTRAETTTADPPPPWIKLPRFVHWMITCDSTKQIFRASVSPSDARLLRNFIKL